MNRFPRFFLPVLIAAAALYSLSRFAHAQDEDLRLQVVDLKGKAFVYRDEDDETSRLHKGQKVDDGDKISTEPKSEIVLRLKGRSYLHLSPNSKIAVTKLRWNDSRGVQFRVNLIKGRVLFQLDKVQKPGYEISAGKLLFRAHGTLFEAYRKKEEIHLTSYEGVMVVNFPGHTEMIKARQVMKIEDGRFRYKHYLKLEDEGRLEVWKDQLAEIREKNAKGPR